MDPYAHTFIALALLFTSHFLGKKIGRQEGISAAVIYMIEMGVCTEEDLQRANEKFDEEEDDV